MRLTYFAQPIDQAGKAIALRGTLVYIQETARIAGVSLFRPATAYSLARPASRYASPETLSAVDAVNRAALDTCESLMAFLPAGSPTLGTPVEIDYMLDQGKPVVIVTDIEGSVQITNWTGRGAKTFTSKELPQGAALRELLQPEKPAPELPSPLPDFLRQVDVMPITVGPGATVPERAYDDDAGFDLTVTEDTIIGPHEAKLIPTEVAVALPPGMWGLIVGRSSTWSKLRLDVKLGVIDAGWRGPLYVSVFNPMPGKITHVQAGQRLAQLIPLPAWSGKLEEVDRLEPHPRGTNGFGSSGS